MNSEFFQDLILLSRTEFCTSGVSVDCSVDFLIQVCKESLLKTTEAPKFLKCDPICQIAHDTE